MVIIEKSFFNPWDTPGVQVEEFAIGGKMLIAQLAFTETDVLQHWDDESWRNAQRQKLVHLLASKMLSENLCEITTYEDYLNGNKIINARCYITPSDQVKVLRSLKK